MDNLNIILVADASAAFLIRLLNKFIIDPLSKPYPTANIQPMLSLSSISRLSLVPGTTNLIPLYAFLINAIIDCDPFPALTYFIFSITLTGAAMRSKANVSSSYAS